MTKGNLSLWRGSRVENGPLIYTVETGYKVATFLRGKSLYSLFADLFNNHPKFTMGLYEGFDKATL